MAKIKFKENVLKASERYLRSNKTGDFIRTSDKIELRHRVGYSIRVEFIDYYFEVECGYITRKPNVDTIEQTYIMRFNTKGLHEKEMEEKIIHFIKNGNKQK